MKLLTKSGLYGKGLVPISLPPMVERYNLALEAIGMQRTSLKKFNIDGWGWSPEIAEEFGDENYLTQGMANPNIIILTPEQKNASIYFPSYSFDHEIHQLIFQSADKHIQDITVSDCLYINVDQGIDMYLSPTDLLDVDHVVLRFHTPSKTMEAARYQHKLVQQFKKDDEAFLNRDFHRDIIGSFKEHGDMRYLNLDIKDLSYSNVTSFYCSLFGGVFVLRDTVSTVPLVVYNKKQQEISSDFYKSFQTHDEELLHTLIEEGLIELSMAYYQENPDRLDRIYQYLLLKEFCKIDKDIGVPISHTDFRKLSAALVKKQKITPQIYELQKVKSAFAKGDISILDRISVDTKKLLYHPHTRFDSSYIVKVLWQLLNHISSSDIEKLYEFDKPFFYTCYKDFPKVMKQWSIGYLQTHYYVQHKK